MLSAVAFAATVAVVVRVGFVEDGFASERWEPNTRSYTMASLSFRSRGASFQAERRIAAPQDDASAVPAMDGSIVHTVSPVADRDDTPLLWAYHYRDSNRVSVFGLTESWRLMFRYEIPLAVFSILPSIAALRWRRRRRAARRQGFAVLPQAAIDSKVGATS